MMKIEKVKDYSVFEKVFRYLDLSICNKVIREEKLIDYEN